MWEMKVLKTYCRYLVMVQQIPIHRIQYRFNNICILHKHFQANTSVTFCILIFFSFRLFYSRVMTDFLSILRNLYEKTFILPLLFVSLNCVLSRVEVIQKNGMWVMSCFWEVLGRILPLIVITDQMYVASNRWVPKHLRLIWRLIIHPCFSQHWNTDTAWNWRSEKLWNSEAVQL